MVAKCRTQQLLAATGSYVRGSLRFTRQCSIVILKTRVDGRVAPAPRSVPPGVGVAEPAAERATCASSWRLGPSLERRWTSPCSLVRLL